ncbi:MAG: hypothetical protein PHX14_07080 [Syntrophomonadaceae bacterium]|nr:hypothetical protein [Syntrophomonadaceae bacterium]
METKLNQEQRQEIFAPLIDQIQIGQTGYGKFKVFDYEASLGKTYNYCKAIVDNYNSESIEYLVGSAPNPFENNPKTLIVIKMIKEGKEVADKINKFDSEYKHKKKYKQFAIAINGESGINGAKSFDKHDKNQIAEMKKYPAIIITQSMYMQICRDKQLGQDLFGNREILIIDEEIDFVYETFDSITVSRIALIEEKYLKFSNQSQSIFKEVVGDIRTSLASKHDQMKRVSLVKNADWLNQMMNGFKDCLKKAIDDRYIEKLKDKFPDLKVNDNPEYVTKEIVDKVTKIVKFYNDENVIAYKNGLYRYDSNIQPFTLRDNIWLDASASFNELYQLDKNLFTIEKSERLVDHSQCTLYYDCENKSTTSGKEDYADFERDVLKQIVESVTDEDKILILDNKDDCKHIDDEFKKLKDMNHRNEQELNDNDICPIDSINYFAMRGRNIWGDYNKCYCIQQPQNIFPYYVFLYEYWTKEKLENKEIYLSNYKDPGTGYKTFGFTLPKTINGEEIIYSEEEMMRNKQLEKLRQTSQVSSIYQGLKRIQRNTNPKADYYVITTDKKIFDILKNQFMNIRVRNYKFNLEYKNPNKVSDTAVKRLNNWADIIENNKIVSYEEIAELCETSVENLKRILIRHEDIIVKLKHKNIMFYNFNKSIEWLAKINIGEQELLTRFEEQFNVTWKSFKRNKSVKEIINRRNIVVNKGLLVANL